MNRVLSELVARSTKNNIVNDRVHLAVLGYRNNAVYDAIPSLPGLVSIQGLAANPIRVENRTKREYDSETGQMIEIPTPFQVWIDPVGDGGTPMTAALNRAHELAAAWAASYQQCYPPIIVNITDGMATDRDPGRQPQTSAASPPAMARPFCSTATSPRPTSLRSAILRIRLRLAHLANQFAMPLFEASSLIPDTMRTNALSNLHMTLAPYARGFVFNGDIESVIQMLTFVTVALTWATINNLRELSAMCDSSMEVSMDAAIDTSMAADDPELRGRSYAAPRPHTQAYWLTTKGG